MADNNPSTDNQPDEQLDWEGQMLAEVMDAPALLTREAMFEDEATFQAEGWIRRTAVAIQTKTGRELCEDAKHDRGFAIALAAWLSAVGAHIKRTEAIVEIMGSAQARVLVALACREDMKEILEEARQMDTPLPSEAERTDTMH